MTPFTPPTVLAKRIGATGNVGFWCPHCDAAHIHSLPDGHKLPHCTNRSSPYLATGYILRVSGRVDYWTQLRPKPTGATA